MCIQHIFEAYPDLEQDTAWFNQFLESEEVAIRWVGNRTYVIIPCEFSEVCSDPIGQNQWYRRILECDEQVGGYWYEMSRLPCCPEYVMKCNAMLQRRKRARDWDWEEESLLN